MERLYSFSFGPLYRIASPFIMIRWRVMRGRAQEQEQEQEQEKEKEIEKEKKQEKEKRTGQSGFAKQATTCP